MDTLSTKQFALGELLISYFFIVVHLTGQSFVASSYNIDNVVLFLQS
jgi:hypothetical protein